MRVTLCSETYFPQLNGVSRSLDRLVRSLIDAGDDVQLLIPEYPGGAGEAEACVRVDSFPSVPCPVYPEVRLPLARPRRVRRALDAFGPEVLHIATEGPLGYVALRQARARSIPAVSSYHTNFSMYARAYHASVLTPVVWRYLRWFHNRTAATLCPTRSMRDVLAGKGFSNVGVWSRGVDAELFSPERKCAALRREFGLAPDDLVLAYVGRLAEEKGLGLLLEAFEAITRERSARLLLVGDGPSRHGLQRRGVPGVVFAGYARGTRLAGLYASADLFLFPSVTETFGNVVLESLASGVPVVAFDVPGPRDILQDGVTGALARQVSSDSLAQAAITLMDDAPRRVIMGRAARCYAREQTWSSVNDAVRQAYSRAVRR